MQVVVGVLAMLAGAALAVVGWRGWQGALRRNRFVGVRTPATMASDEAFRLGNQVSGPVLVAAGAVALVGGLAALAAPSVGSFAVVCVVAGVGTVALSVAGGVLGSRAAAAIPARPAACGGCSCGGGGCAR